MQSVDLLIADIDWLITIDTQRRVIRDASVAVDQGKIVAIDRAAEIAKRFAGVASRGESVWNWRSFAIAIVAANTPDIAEACTALPTTKNASSSTPLYRPR